MTSSTDTSVLSATVAMVERMVHDRMEIVSAGPCPELPVLSEYIDIISRLTAIRKSLFNMQQSVPSTSSPNRHSPPADHRPTDSALRQPATINHKSPQSPRLHQVHQVPAIHAIPIDRIAPELDAIVKKLDATAPAQSSNPASPPPTHASPSEIHDSRSPNASASPIHDPQSTIHDSRSPIGAHKKFRPLKKRKRRR